MADPVVPPDNPYNKPETCRTCPLFTNPGIVWGDGPNNAKLMFVGEAPGEDEAAYLKPFVGGSGKVLSAQCQQIGLDRRDVFVTNVVKCRPTARTVEGRLTNRPPTETEIRNCARFLKHELDTVRPNAIVAFGNVPMATLTGAKKGITLVRSVPINGPKRPDAEETGVTHYKVIGTLHPAYVMRAQDLWPAAVFDIARAQKEAHFPQIVRRQWKHHIHAKLSEVGPRLEAQIRERRSGYMYYSHDLETTGLSGHTDTIRCTGVAANPDEVYVFDNTLDVIEFMKKLHGDPELLTIGQNSENFDIPFQMAKGYEFNGPTYDTMIGWHLLNSALPKDLGFIGATVTDEPYWKDDTMYKSGDDALQVGCAKDVHATARAFEDQLTELEQLNQLDLYFNQIMPLQPVLRHMTQRGVRKDLNRAGAWHVILNRKADELEAKLKRGLGNAAFDVNSPKQLMDLLYKQMGLPVQYTKDRERGFRPTVDADALDALALKTNNPILTLIRSIRTLRKWDSTYILCPHDNNGFVHPKFGSAKAATGRLNSWDPNAQNWPSEVREILVPDNEDCVLLSRDWSQIEWRLAMLLSGDKVGIEAMVKGIDAHQIAYAQAFQKLYEEVTTIERYEAKFINYGLLYGRSEESIAAGRAGHPESAIPLDRVKKYVKGFFTTFAGYNKFREEMKNFVLRNHYYATAWGRRRWWYTRQLPEIYNFPMQGNAAHMMYIALIDLERELQNISGATLRMTVHDEVVVNTPKDQKTLKAVQECTRDVMEQTFDKIVEASMYPDVVRHYYPNGWSCKSDCHIGTTWRACKPETREEKEVEKELRALLGVPT